MQWKWSRIYAVLVLAGRLLGWPAAAAALDYVTIQRGGKQVEVAGKALVEAQDGGLMLRDRDSSIWLLQLGEIVSRRSDDVPFQPFTADEMAPRLLAELPKGFEIHRTAHYLVCHNGSRGYAQWCGSLFERLYMAFTNFWSHRGFDLSEPEYPLVAVVFASRASYAQYAKTEVGEAVDSIVAYYNLKTNRMAMFDLTGVAALGDPSRTVSKGAQINRILSRPGAAQAVATIVHEATHQIAFNCGLHTRFSDCPVWFSEGIATYFETPDLSSAKGWRNIGNVNGLRLRQFRDYLRRRPADSLVTLLTKDARLRDPKLANDAYAEAWALTYFLMWQRPEEFVAYLRILSQKEPMRWGEEKNRLTEFQQIFGKDLQALDQEFVRYTLRLR